MTILYKMPVDLLPDASPVCDTACAVVLTRAHFRRLREVYRSAGWPSQDTLEIELLAAGMLERITAASGHETLRVTDGGMVQLANTLAGNKAARSAHEALVERVAQEMGRAGRLVWRGLSLRAQVPHSAAVAEPATDTLLKPERNGAMPMLPTPAQASWVIACPDVFSIRNTSVEAYLEPIVHEIKVSRADLMGDLKKPLKRAAYLGMGGECWYVLGQTAKGKPIANPDEVPPECGVMLCEGDRLVIARSAPRKPVAKLPFHVWMSLAKAGPAVRGGGDAQEVF